MKKHQIGFIASALAFPAITCTLYLSMGFMLKNKQWKTEKEVFPIFGRYNNGKSQPSHKRVLFKCDTLILSDDQAYNSFSEHGQKQDEGTIFIDTSGAQVKLNKNTLQIKGTNDYMQKTVYKIPVIKFINCSYYLNQESFMFAQNTYLNINRTHLKFYNSYDDNDYPEPSSPDNKYVQDSNLKINIEASDSSEIMIKNKALGYHWNIVLKNKSYLAIIPGNNKINGTFTIFYDESCTINIPTSLLKNCTLIRE